MFDNQTESHLLADVIIGAVGGLAGTLAMQAYWKAVTRISGSDPRSQRRQTDGQTGSIALLGSHHQPRESSTEAFARLGYEVVESDEPNDARKTRLSQWVHWSYGAAQGAMYDVIARRVDAKPGWLAGVGYGAAMWLLGDELAVPALGLADGPRHFPIGQHLHRLGSHVTYGVAAALTASTLHRARPATGGRTD